MSDFTNLTVVTVDGREGDRGGALRAIALSQRQLPGARGLLLSPDRPASLPPGIAHVPIAPMGYFEYSFFMLYALHQFIETEWCLVVQEDGWVLDGSNWRDAFWRYDYIGAPAHSAKVRPAGQPAQYVRRFAWADGYRDDGTVHYVMNGGFSLRSKRLLEAPTRLRLPFSVSPMAAVRSGERFALALGDDSHLEDVQLCVHLRERLESAGMRFPPLGISRLFAFERLCPAIHGDLALATVLGHHFSFRRLRSVDPPEVDYAVTPEEFSLMPDEQPVRELFLRYGYRVAFTG